MDWLWFIGGDVSGTVFVSGALLRRFVTPFLIASPAMLTAGAPILVSSSPTVAPIAADVPVCARSKLVLLSSPAISTVCLARSSAAANTAPSTPVATEAFVTLANTISFRIPLMPALVACLPACEPATPIPKVANPM